MLGRKSGLRRQRFLNLVFATIISKSSHFGPLQLTDPGISIGAMKLLNAQDIARARNLLAAGDVVAIPTETVYGLAASIDCESALRKVFALKGRPFFDPLIVHVNSLKQARSVVREWPPVADFLARFFWPGPLTMVLPKAANVNPLITAGHDTVAIRIPRHDLTLELISQLGTPIAAPSANRFGRTSPSRAEHVLSEFPSDNLFVLDGGPCEVGLESTVISFVLGSVLGSVLSSTSDDRLSSSASETRDSILPKVSEIDQIQILRPGGISEAELVESLTRWSRPTVVTRLAGSERSPGTLRTHYQPNIPLVILSSQADPCGQETRDSLEKNMQRKIVNPVELDLNEDPIIAARELYHDMRRLAESGADVLVVQRCDQKRTGSWEAIWDRLTRAATLDLSR